MRTLFILFLILYISGAAFGDQSISEKEKVEIESILSKQVDAWNEGNLEKFMATYLKSEKLVFVGSRGPTYGWKATLDSYKKAYPDMAAMGKLKLKPMNISKIDTKTVLLIGRFELRREMGDLAGHFTLVIQKIDGHWLIISDHSSSE